MNDNVIVASGRSENANELCKELRDQAFHYAHGSHAVDRLEWRAASVIRQLLYEKDIFKRTFESQKQSSIFSDDIPDGRDLI